MFAMKEMKPQPNLRQNNPRLARKCTKNCPLEEDKSLLQRRASTPAPAANEAPPIVHDVLRSPGQPLDESTRSFMEPRFGHDFSQVRVHTDAKAAESARAVNALAYTVGRDIVMKRDEYAPATDAGKRLLAHELAHVVQQGGSQRLQKLQVGAAGDVYEQEADRVAERVVGMGMVVEGGSSWGESHPTQVLQRYIDTKISSNNWRVADDLNMAVRQDSPVYGSHFFYAESALIKSSSDILKKQKSHLEMKAGSDTMQVTSTDGKSKKTLSRVEPENKNNKTSGNQKHGGMLWPDDCGNAANSVMQGSDRKGKAVYSGPPESFWQELVSFCSGKKNFEHETMSSEYGTDTMPYRGENLYSPHILLDEVFKATMNDKDPAKAYTKYQALTPVDREKFDQRVGINKYAQPNIGEAYSIVANKDEFVEGKSAWNFHWGGVVMRSGGDSVTMENFAGSGEDAWDFQMYGSPNKVGQTFHEQQQKRRHGSQAEYGDHPTTIVVRPE